MAWSAQLEEFFGVPQGVSRPQTVNCTLAVNDQVQRLWEENRAVMIPKKAGWFSKSPLTY